jgi:sRNA-binding protein
MSGHKLDLRKATIARLAQLYPACFYAARQQRRPRKIGIRRDLATLDLGIGRRELDSALAWYVNGISYLQSLRVGTDRIGLDGSPVGVVRDADEAHAKAKLAVLGARRASDAEANSLLKSVGAGTVASRVRVLSPYRVAEARLSIGKQSGVFAPARKSEPAASGRAGLAGLRAAALARKVAGGNAKFE